MNSSAIFVVPPGVHLLDISGPAHIFYEAKAYGAPLDLHFVRLTGENDVASSAGLQFSELLPFEQFTLTDQDFVFVPGLSFEQTMDSRFLSRCKPFFAWLVQQHHHGALACSVCTGSFLLAAAGLLDGKRCTTHWKRLAAFQQCYPNAITEQNRLFVQDGHIYTSAGISSGIDLALYLLEEKFGSKLAVDIAKEAVVYFRRGPEDPQLSIYLRYRNHIEERIHDAQAFITQNIGRPFNLEDVADSVHMSVRNLTRLFKKTLGITIHYYTEQLRVERAANLLAENNKLELVAAQCGFKSTSQLNSMLKKNTR